MFKRNRITLFCLIGSVFGVSMMIGMMRSKPISPPSIDPVSTPPYKPLAIKESIVPNVGALGYDESLSDSELKFICLQIIRIVRVFKTNNDGSKTSIPTSKTPPKDYDVNSIENFPNILVDYCRDMARSSAKYEFHQTQNQKYFTTNYILTDEEYRKGKAICLKCLILHEKILRENRGQ